MAAPDDDHTQEGSAPATPQPEGIASLGAELRRELRNRRYSTDAAQNERELSDATMALVIASILHDFPVDRLAHESLLEETSIVNVYRAIDSLIDRFQELCDEIIVDLLPGEVNIPGTDLYSSPGLLAANRRLKKINDDMHQIASSLQYMLKGDSVLRQRLSVVAVLAARITIFEETVTIYLDDGRATEPEWGDEASAVRAYQYVQLELDKYRSELRAATAAFMTARKQAQGKAASSFLWRTSWRRAGTILVGLATVIGATAAILALFIK
jgi:hypothetical protein